MFVQIVSGSAKRGKAVPFLGDVFVVVASVAVVVCIDVAVVVVVGSITPNTTPACRIRFTCLFV